MKIPSLAPQRPPWYRLLAAGDTFQDEEGIVYTVVYVDESGRADIEWFSPSCKRLLRSREHISDRWIAARSTPISVAAMKAPEVAPWRERVIQLIETAHRHTDRINHPDTLVSGGLRIAIGGGGGCVVLTRDDVAEPVFLHSPEFVGAVDARLKELKIADLRYRDDANVLLIEALIQ